MKMFTHTFQSSASNNVIPAGIQLFIRLLLLILAGGFISAVIFLGVDKLSSIFLEKIILTAKVLMLSFVFIIYPLSRIHPVKRFLSLPSLLMGHLLGACAWGYSLLFVMTSLGIWGILFCFLFQTLTPITIIGAIWKGAWGVVGNLSLWIIMSFIIKLFSSQLLVESIRQQKEEKIIDIKADRVIDI